MVDMVNMADDAGDPEATEAYHLPDEGWDCAACGAAWPCEVTRTDLVRDLGGTPAAIDKVMRGYLLDALTVRPDLPSRELADRHLSWIGVSGSP
ncbi:hypothetical protein HDA40_006927 [Hamadaea flava]|uniref:Flavin reductase n=1 Tax=Hamadaea flava TaxID=1742688 RepID=A0ABV8M0J1_9ACTN|nr:hypothetical protein [Hamadaea flava]MCP2328420.1 hypothetical protein [Hamadaea flava]